MFIYNIKFSTWVNMDGVSGLRLTNHTVKDADNNPTWVDIPWEQVEEVARQMIQWFDTKDYMSKDGVWEKADAGVMPLRNFPCGYIKPKKEVG